MTLIAIYVKSYLETKKVSVDIALDKSLSVSHPNVEKIIESMRYSLMAGGKRVRPILTIAACEMFGGSEAGKYVCFSFKRYQ